MQMLQGVTAPLRLGGPLPPNTVQIAKCLLGVCETGHSEAAAAVLSSLGAKGTAGGGALKIPDECRE